ncbi:helix-turn-helix domain-containing protein [Chryseobacterium sp. B21-037]|uniref:helix-turn-helix domain-containing protein n=1 Tax=Chryseobacterium sp. B21-037 TaxID=2926038 RepID=UPI00235843F4|nr:helix-turn-helix transcriptional regulator [Chryseobacterium sp. B21-037]MDC8104709.1 helix-turn-helix domain-containing protein [Chryseobacterium sp. B21-037]
MEKLRSLRKKRGYTQEYMSNILSTDVSNYCRKESGDVRIFDDEWEKLAKALDVPVEDIKEERKSGGVHNENFTLSDSATAGNYYEQYYNIPNQVMDNLQDYIKLLKEQVEALKQEVEKLKSEK